MVLLLFFTARTHNLLTAAESAGMFGVGNDQQYGKYLLPVRVKGTTSIFV